jgi:hypothetical protein
MELKVSFDLKPFERLMQKYPEAARAAKISRITESLLLLEAEIKKETPMGAGPVHLRDTIFHQVNTGEPVWGMVSTPAKYGEPVELGTRPHFPPVAPIQYWVEKQLGLSGKEAKSVAFLIARAISKRGTKPRKMFTNTLEKKRAQVLGILGQIPADIVKAVGA